MITVEKHFSSSKDIKGSIISGSDGKHFDITICPPEEDAVYLKLTVLGRKDFKCLLKEIADAGGTMLDATTKKAKRKAKARSRKKR